LARRGPTTHKRKTARAFRLRDLGYFRRARRKSQRRRPGAAPQGFSSPAETPKKCGAAAGGPTILEQRVKKKTLALAPPMFPWAEQKKNWVDWQPHSVQRPTAQTFNDQKSPISPVRTGPAAVGKKKIIPQPGPGTAICFGRVSLGGETKGGDKGHMDNSNGRSTKKPQITRRARGLTTSRRWAMFWFLDLVVGGQLPVNPKNPFVDCFRTSASGCGRGAPRTSLQFRYEKPRRPSMPLGAPQTRCSASACSEERGGRIVWQGFLSGKKTWGDPGGGNRINALVLKKPASARSQVFEKGGGNPRTKTKTGTSGRHKQNSCGKIPQ